MKQIEASGLKITKTYYCPHSLDDNCECHKPKPKLILDAAEEYGIDLANSYMIGDRLSDIMAGKNAGTKTILVKTGNKPVEDSQADYEAKDLVEAVRYIAERS